jgi:hypothetical protein
LSQLENAAEDAFRDPRQWGLELTGPQGSDLLHLQAERERQPEFLGLQNEIGATSDLDLVGGQHGQDESCRGVNL